MGEDVSLTFDNKMFLRGLEEISKKMDSLTGVTKKSADKMSSGISMSALSFLKINAALSLAKMGISKLMSNIPEIGRTFSIAGDIISRNFLFPLRQQLVPYLQKFLNWVRDNRQMFVRWGSVLVNVFQVVIQGVKSALAILKPFYDAAMKFFKDVFWSTADSIDKIANMVLFKISAVMVYLEAVLGPAMRGLANIVFSIMNAIKEFVAGVAEGFSMVGGFLPELKEFIKALGELADSLFGTGIAWREFGKIIGIIVGGALKGVFQILTFLIKGLSATIDLVKVLAGSMNMKEFSIKHNSPSEEKIKEEERFKSAPVLSQEQVMSGIGSTQASGTKKVYDQSSKVNITNLVVHANSEAEGKAAGRALHQELRRSVNQAQAQKGM